ncbi:hypothetical protein GCM10022224_046950 [Nonomuraea antimicrobica]|uniref:Uncharacterized protein n=1 Tax=Nonomuraea antimicrobica TaxID=561173 RepID=A0ABP7C4X2_9ACTN
MCGIGGRTTACRRGGCLSEVKDGTRRPVREGEAPGHGPAWYCTPPRGFAAPLPLPDGTVIATNDRPPGNVPNSAQTVLFHRAGQPVATRRERRRALAAATFTDIDDKSFLWSLKC